jgi:hypothetical protein
VDSIHSPAVLKICGQFSPGQHDGGIYRQDPVLETGEQIPLRQPRAIRAQGDRGDTAAVAGEGSDSSPEAASYTLQVRANSDGQLGAIYLRR